MTTDLRGYDDWLISGESGNAPEQCTRCGDPCGGDNLCRDCMVALVILHALEDRRGLPLSRAGLEELTGLPDRTNRRIIADKLRRFGEAVCVETSRTDGQGHKQPTGYFLAQDDSDRDALEEMYHGRALAELSVINALRRRRAEKSGRQAVLVEIVWDVDGQGALVMSA